MPSYPYNTEFTPIAQKLRRNMTREEKHLWYDLLLRLPCTVHSQGTILNYIVDFYIPRGRLVIEIDGSQHYSPEYKQKDAERDEMLATFGISVARYSNDSIRNYFENVCREILEKTGFSFEDLKPPRVSSKVYKDRG